MYGDGFGYGSLAVVGIAASVGGWLLGDKRGQSKAGSRWETALTKCAETGLPTGSDLNEAERKTLFATLKKHADDIGVTASKVTDRMQAAAMDILGRAGVRQFVTGEKRTDAVILAELEGETETDQALAREAAVH